MLKLTSLAPAHYFLGAGGQFVVKDIVLLGASLWSLGEAGTAILHQRPR